MALLWCLRAFPLQSAELAAIPIATDGERRFSDDPFEHHNPAFIPAAAARDALADVHQRPRPCAHRHAKFDCRTHGEPARPTGDRHGASTRRAGHHRLSDLAGVWGKADDQ
jgi:hypothetical protein